MIGNIVKIRTPYFDSLSKTTKFKSRPGLVIGNYGLIDSDYIVLPVSKISDAKMRNPDYDLAIDPKIYPLSKLTSFSYIRCHKQVSIRKSEIGDIICDFKSAYPEKYLECLELLEKFDDEKIYYAI